MMRPHRLLLDASIVKPDSCGYGTYTASLARALAERADCELVIATSMPEAFAAAKRARVIALSRRTRDFAFRAVWREVRLPALVRKLAPDVLVAPVPEFAIRQPPVPTIAVIHDVSQIMAPRLYGWTKWLRFNLGHRHILATADAVVCVSHATLVGLRQTVSDRVDHVRVIGEGPQELPEARVNGWRSRPYLLVVGALAPHKNVATLVEAFGQSGLGDEFDLVLSGPPDGRAGAELRRIAVAHGVGARIEHVGFLSPQDLAAAYRNASALAFPSLIEGFGLPVLEAMQLGTPVVASGLPSVREVAGDAALFVERPLDAEAWASALRRVVESGVRERLSRAGAERARAFTWERTAAEFIELVEAVTP